GRKLRRYKRRWKVERLFAWLQNFRRLVVRYDRHADNFLAFLLLACSIILLRFFEIGCGTPPCFDRGVMMLAGPVDHP
ncbi:transposase, partial [Candidatus Electronema sp. PJ]|uniref:transposase n=1 Tax=Candidatus Electronema sp. PJ TaxID=3401572 RepID=UPI003AA96885